MSDWSSFQGPKSMEMGSNAFVKCVTEPNPIHSPRISRGDCHWNDSPRSCDSPPVAQAVLIFSC